MWGRRWVSQVPPPPPLKVLKYFQKRTYVWTKTILGLRLRVGLVLRLSMGLKAAWAFASASILQVEWNLYARRMWLRRLGLRA